MDKNDEVYILLQKIGLTDEEIQEAVRVNRFLTKVIDTDIKKRLIWLSRYNIGLDKVKDLIKENPFIIIEDFSRIKMIEDMYKSVGLENKDIKQVILSNPHSFSIDPIDLKRYIEGKKQNNISNEDIKKDILENL